MKDCEAEAGGVNLHNGTDPRMFRYSGPNALLQEDVEPLNRNYDMEFPGYRPCGRPLPSVDQALTTDFVVLAHNSNINF